MTCEQRPLPEQSLEVDYGAVKAVFSPSGLILLTTLTPDQLGDGEGRYIFIYWLGPTPVVDSLIRKICYK